MSSTSQKGGRGVLGAKWLWPAVAVAGAASAGLAYYYYKLYASASSAKASGDKADGLSRGFLIPPSSASADGSPAASPTASSSSIRRSTSASGLAGAVPQPADADLSPQQRAAEAIRQKGNNAFKAGKFREAVQAYTEALSLGPHPYGAVRCYTNRAIAETRLKEWDAALVDAMMATTADPEFSKAYYMAGQAYMGLGLPHRAAGMFATAKEKSGGKKAQADAEKQRAAAAEKAAAMTAEEVKAAEDSVYAARDAAISALLKAAEAGMIGSNKTVADYNNATGMLLKALMMGELDDYKNNALKADVIRLLGRSHFLAQRFQAAAEMYSAHMGLAQMVKDAGAPAGADAGEVSATGARWDADIQESKFFLAQSLRALGANRDDIIRLLTDAANGPVPSLKTRASTELIKVYKTMRAAEADGSDKALELDALIASLDVDVAKPSVELELEAETEAEAKTETDAAAAADAAAETETEVDADADADAAAETETETEAEADADAAAETEAETDADADADAAAETEVDGAVSEVEDEDAE
ncbi:uncharacterized protein AMSG_07463 [Thecamonas trahens ATCC 50062]|uniref:Uncharacterized protein n=1 Tax=Thecamonas trahens ATCC 50062 TaxID=461836 RepID=A0A0L0DJU4_THETB|nr:hypothetical protein AMSG_07463 [Thecamonas trahens ATCC 50062]KNC51563.1 hypothetical protein AMSG_07463 [Thecamonas trahens ATCC 50062]|eukprot:XP_013755965.1 hypothetical protein AMSG_07463 [Thecamonas trahens ATCC 50062]